MADVDKPQDLQMCDLAELRQKVVEAEEKLQSFRRREEAMGRIRDQILAAQELDLFFPQLEERWIEELRDLGIPLHKFSLQLPADQVGYFVEYSSAVQHLPRESVRHCLADYPWVQVAWESGKPVVVSREQLECGRFPDEVRCHLEVPLPGEGSVGVSSTKEDVFEDESIWIVQIFAGLIAEGLQRLEDFEEKTQSQDRLSQILETARMGSWEWNLQTGEIVWCENLAPLLGLHTDTFVGSSQSFLEHVYPEDRELLVKLFNRTAEGGADYDIEFRIAWPDKTIRWVGSQGRIFFDETSRPVQLIGVVIDLTRHKQLEEEMLQLQKMETIGMLAGGIAHDFNNLLMGILGFSSLVREALPADDPSREEIEEVLKIVDQGTVLTNRLLAFGRRQIIQPRLLDLSAVIADMDKMLRRLIGDNIEISTLFGTGGICVKTDPGQIEQVIVNLAINARDAMPEGGKLTIEAASVELDEIYARQHPDVIPGAYIRLTVSDTGCGMDQETQSHIFEPFFSTKEPDKGTGLGLSTVYGIVKQNNGRIEVSSEPGQGTTFTLYLPQVEEAVEEIIEEQHPTALLRGSETILLVDDDELVRNPIHRMLSQDGYTLLEAGSGEEALQVCAQYQDPIDLLVTDVMMPRMNGPELAEQLKILRPNVKVLYISGHPERAGELIARMESDAPLLPKPFAFESLLDNVRKVLGAPL